ncbi:glutathione-disulfide reductase [Luteimonas arsenica]|uniref:glutathione-disulfide reductase n=1 Tax=Luteimonas arsenica TaxID=1586242 RepID=UPI0010550A36|nr:glutathione-disulfide reductase [Luteimonas arsenica]
MSADRGLHVDLAVVGGGSGGLAAAFRAAGHGARVALLEPGELGGTCVNVGCVPKKAMWLAAELGAHIRMASALGFPVEPACPDWAQLIASRQRYIANIHASYRRRLDEAGIVLLPARGRLTGGGMVECEDGNRLEAKHILVATGGRPVRPDIPGAELGIDSDGFFALSEAPRRVAIIGGGYIGVELAGVLQALGSRVELFVRGDSLLKGFDPEVVERLQGNMHQAGIALHFGYSLAALEACAGGGARLCEQGGDTGEPFDAVIFATGRRPNTDGLGLEAAGVRTAADGHVEVDAFQATSAKRVYAVGDVTGRLALTPVAIAEGRRLMDRVFGGEPDACVDHDNVATVVFSHPPLGKVGLTEAEARERFGHDAVSCHGTTFRPMLHALADAQQHSMFKAVCVGKEKRVVGLHLVGEAADEILQGFAVAVKLGATLADFHATVAIHPTSAEEIVLLR